MCVCVRVCVCACVCLCEVKTRNLIIAQQAELIGFIQLLPPQLGSVDKQILFEHVTPYAPKRPGFPNPPSHLSQRAGALSSRPSLAAHVQSPATVLGTPVQLFVYANTCFQSHGTTKVYLIKWPVCVYQIFTNPLTHLLLYKYL